MERACYHQSKRQCPNGLPPNDGNAARNSRHQLSSEPRLGGGPSGLVTGPFVCSGEFHREQDLIRCPAGELPAATAATAKAAKEAPQATFSRWRTGRCAAHRGRTANRPGDTNCPACGHRYLAASADISGFLDAADPATAIAVDVGLTAQGHHRNTGNFGPHRSRTTGLRTRDRGGTRRSAGLAAAPVTSARNRGSNGHHDDGNQGTHTVHFRRLLIRTCLIDTCQSTAANRDPPFDPDSALRNREPLQVLAIWAM